MKRVLALLTLLSVTAMIFSCNNGGQKPAIITTESTVTQDTSATAGRAEGSSSAQKPATPANPAVKEINAAIENTLRLSSYKISHEKAYRAVKASESAEISTSEIICIFDANTNNPAFSITQRSGAKNPYKQSDLFCKNGYLYASICGVYAKIPAGGEGAKLFSAENVTYLTKRIMIPLHKVPSISSSVYKDYTVYKLHLHDEEAQNSYRDIAMDILSDAHANTAISFTITDVSLTISVTKTGYVNGYSVSVQADTSDAIIKRVILEESIAFESFRESIPDEFPENEQSYINTASYLDLPAAIFKEALHNTENSAGMITSVHGTFTSPENSIFGAYTEIEGTVYSQNETWREFYTSQTDGKETYRDVYFGDGYYYLDDNGKKSVIPASLFSPDLTISPLYRLHHIEGNDIYDVLMQEDKNGTVKISAKIKGEAFSQKYKDNLAQTAFIISGGREISRILIHSADLTVAITDIGANKYVVSYSLSYSIDIIIDIGGAKFAVSVNALITVKNTDIGEIIPVPPPDGYAEYTNI